MADNRKDLVALIKANPGATFMIDNDCWWMLHAQPKPFDEMTDQDWEDWGDSRITGDGEVTPRGSGYGSGHRYGGDILQALAEIVGVKVESV